MSLISPIPLIIIHGNEALVPRLAAAPRVALGGSAPRQLTSTAANARAPVAGADAGLGSRSMIPPSKSHICRFTVP